VVTRETSKEKALKILLKILFLSFILTVSNSAWSCNLNPCHRQREVHHRRVVGYRYKTVRVPIIEDQVVPSSRPTPCGQCGGIVANAVVDRPCDDGTGYWLLRSRVRGIIRIRPFAGNRVYTGMLVHINMNGSWDYPTKGAGS
jgi:hypothetical protein